MEHPDKVTQKDLALTVLTLGLMVKRLVTVIDDSAIFPMRSNAQLEIESILGILEKEF